MQRLISYHIQSEINIQPMALPRGGRTKPNTTPLHPAKSQLQGCPYPNRTALRTHITAPYPCQVRRPPTSAHTHPEAYYRTKGAQSHLQGWPSPPYCESNLLSRLHSCTSNNPSGSHSRCPLYPIPFEHRKPRHATPSSWSHIPQGNNISNCLLGASGVGQIH